MGQRETVKWFKEHFFNELKQRVWTLLPACRVEEALAVRICSDSLSTGSNR